MNSLEFWWSKVTGAVSSFSCEISANPVNISPPFEQLSPELKDLLIRFPWSKVKGHSDLRRVWKKMCVE